MKNIFVVLGKSGSGKSTLSEHISRVFSMSNVVITTSRPAREGEVDGIDYHFLTKEEFEYAIINDEFLQYSSFRNWYYGIEKISLDVCSSKNIIIVLSPEAYIDFSNSICKLSYKVIPIFIHCDDRIRLQRCLNRDSDIDEVVRRYQADKIDFEGIADKVLRDGGFIIDSSYGSVDTVLSNFENYVLKYIKGNF